MTTCQKCTIYSDLSAFFNVPELSDVRLYTKTRTLHASSLLLAAHSAVFRALLREDPDRDVFLDKFLEEEEEMEMLVGSLYLSSRLAVTMDNLYTVAKFGIVYEIGWITDRALDFLKSNLSHGNCITATRTSCRLKHNFKYLNMADECMKFLNDNKFLEQIVEELEALSEDALTALPSELLTGLLNNRYRRDEPRIVALVRRWFKVDSNLIEAMVVLPLLQLPQLYLADQAQFTDLFEELLVSPFLTKEDRKQLLDLSVSSVTQSKACMVTGLGFSRQFEKGLPGPTHLRGFLDLATWRRCSFQDLVMVKQFSGVAEFSYLEVFLSWVTENPGVSEGQVKVILSSVVLRKISEEFLEDVICDLRHKLTLSDDFDSDIKQRIADHKNQAKPPRRIPRQFAEERLTTTHIKHLKLKKHTLMTRPCSVPECYQRSLAFVDIKLKSDSFPFYKTGKVNINPTPLQHCHNYSVLHVYFVKDDQVISTFTETWDGICEKLESSVIKVVCRGD